MSLPRTSGCRRETLRSPTATSSQASTHTTVDISAAAGRVRTRSRHALFQRSWSSMQLRVRHGQALPSRLAVWWHVQRDYRITTQRDSSLDHWPFGRVGLTSHHDAHKSRPRSARPPTTLGYRSATLIASFASLPGALSTTQLVARSRTRSSRRSRHRASSACHSWRGRSRPRC